MSTEVVTIAPNEARVNLDGSGLCAMCESPAVLQIMHRCGQAGGEACVSCWQNHLQKARRVVRAHPESTMFCRHCCDPADVSQTVSMDHLYAVPLVTP